VRGRQHPPGRLPRRQHRAGQVHVEDFPPGVEVEVEQRAEDGVGRGVDHRNVGREAGRVQLAEQLRDRGGVALVADDRQHLGAGGAEPFGRGGEAVGLAGGDGHGGAAADQRLGHGQADAAAGAGHEGAAAGQIKGIAHGPSFSEESLSRPGGPEESARPPGPAL